MTVRRRPRRPSPWLRFGLPIGLSGLAVLAALWATWLSLRQAEAAPPPTPIVVGQPAAADPAPLAEDIELPEYRALSDLTPARLANPHTSMPSRPRTDVLRYTVQPGDSVFGIADSFGVKPETVLWGNYDVLNDDPHLLRPGQELNILPVDGTYYQWQEGDTLQSVAGFFGTEPQEIADWPGNHLDPLDPEVEPGAWVIVPGGQREFRTWLVPTIARGSAGVNTSYLGPGSCSGDFSGGSVGSGAFIWPTGNHYISGNDYWSGHLAIDIAAGEGAAVWAADTGVVVYAGWSNTGYGNMVMIDHGNGWHTLYAHLSVVGVGCGSNVGQGQGIGLAGSTGNSTGPHLHFETRFEGGFVNPWYVLP